MKVLGVPRWRSDKEPAYQCWRHKRCRIDPWVRKIPWRRKWQPSPVFLPGEPHRQRNLAGYSPWGSKELDMTEHTCNECSALVLASESTPPRPLCHAHTPRPPSASLLCLPEEEDRYSCRQAVEPVDEGVDCPLLLILRWTALAFSSNTATAPAPPLPLRTAFKGRSLSTWVLRHLSQLLGH